MREEIRFTETRMTSIAAATLVLVAITREITFQYVQAFSALQKLVKKQVKSDQEQP